MTPKALSSKYPRTTSTKQMRANIRVSPKIGDVAYIFWTLMKNRSERSHYYKNVKCLISFAEMAEFIDKNWKTYMKQYRKWKKTGFSRSFIPTIDRLDSKSDYRIDNIQLLPLESNVRKAKLGLKEKKEVKGGAREDYYRKPKHMCVQCGKKINPLPLLECPECRRQD